MTMSDEVRREYEEMLVRVLVKRGSVVGRGLQYQYGWQNFEATYHLRDCGITSHSRPDEDYWSEWGGTFHDDVSKHGMSVDHVTCACGQLTDVTIRMDEPVMQVAEYVFAELYEATRGKEV